MRYILDDSGYIDSVSCTPFNCKDKSCTEYTGALPSGYELRATTGKAKTHTITDGADGNCIGVAIYGQSTQATTPSPSNPCEIESIFKGVLIKSTGENGQENETYISLNRYLRSLPNGASDRIYNDNGKWYIEKNIEEITLNGSNATFTTEKTNANFYAYYTGFSSTKSVKAYSDCLCNKLAVKSDSNIFNAYEEGISANNKYNAIRICLNSSRVADSSAASLNAWLSANPLTVQYELATPVVTEFTRAAAIEALESIKIYSGITNITADTNIKLTYYKDATDEEYNAALTKWAQNENIRAYKVTDGNLVYDATKASKLEADWARQTGEYSVVNGLSTAGWYRIAKYNNTGANAMSFILNINTMYNYNDSLSATICGNITYNKAKLTALSCLKNSSVISQVRIVKENSEDYIEIYYNASAINSIAVDIITFDTWNRYHTSNIPVISMYKKFEAATDTATVLTTLTL